MIKIFQILKIGFLVSLIRLAFPSLALAVCPVCTIAVGAGLGLSRFLGIDDTVTGLWIGALIISSSFWFVNWVRLKYKLKIKESYLKAGVSLVTGALVLVPLYFADIIGHPFNTLWGIDKLIFGSILGSGIFLFALWSDQKLRQIKGKQFFSYQKIAFPIGFLAIGSLIMYLLTK
jgi:hypothetical protein